MESLFAIGLGLAVRILLDVVSQHDFRVGGSLVGLWEGVVLYHFVEKMPKSHDPYVAYGVRLFVDFLFTESLFRMALVILWTGLGMVLSDIAPVFWYDVGLRHVVRRLRRDMSLLGIPSFSFFSKAPIGSSRVRFHSPSRESVRSQPSVQSTPSTAAPSNATSSSTPTITPSRQKSRRVPGSFPDDCSETTEASSVRNLSLPPPSEPDSDGHSSPSNDQAELEEIEETDDGFVLVPQMEQDALSETNESDISSDSDPSAANPLEIPEEDLLQEDDEDDSLTPTIKNIRLPVIGAELAAETQEVDDVDEVLPPHADVPVIPDEVKETEEPQPEVTQTSGGGAMAESTVGADPASQTAARDTAADGRPPEVHTTADVTSATTTSPDNQPPAADANTNVVSRATVAPSNPAPIRVSTPQPPTSKPTIATNNATIMTPPDSPSRVSAGASNRAGTPVVNGTATQATDATVNSSSAAADAPKPPPTKRSASPAADTRRKTTVAARAITTSSKSGRNVPPAVNARDSSSSSTARPTAKGTGDSTSNIQPTAPANAPDNSGPTAQAGVDDASAVNESDKPPPPPAKDTKPSAQAIVHDTSTADASVQSSSPAVKDSETGARVGADDAPNASEPPAPAVKDPKSSDQGGVGDTPAANAPVETPPPPADDPKPTARDGVIDESAANASVQIPESAAKDVEASARVSADGASAANAPVPESTAEGLKPSAQPGASVQTPTPTAKDAELNPWAATSSANAQENAESTADNTVPAPNLANESSPAAQDTSITAQSTANAPPPPDKNNATPAEQEPTGSSTLRKPKSRMQQLRDGDGRDSVMTEDSEASQRDSILPEGEQAKLDEAKKFRKEAREMDPKIQAAEKARKEALDDHKVALALLKRQEKGALEEKKQKLNKKAERRTFAARNTSIDLGSINTQGLEPSEAVQRILDNLTELVSRQSSGDTTREILVRLPSAKKKNAMAMNAIRTALKAEKLRFTPSQLDDTLVIPVPRLSMNLTPDNDDDDD